MLRHLKILQRTLVLAAIIATGIGLVRAPLTVSAMHQEMVHPGGSAIAPASHMGQSMEVAEESDCSSTECAPEDACLKHCLTQATVRDAEAVLVPQLSLPDVVPPTGYFLAFNEEASSDGSGVESKYRARERLLTTQKKE